MGNGREIRKGRGTLGWEMAVGGGVADFNQRS